MSQQIINVGSAPNDGQGDPIRTAFIKTNNNFSQLFANSSTPTTIINGNSNISIATASSNAIITINNVTSATFFSTGMSLAGNVTTGNLNANYLYGNGFHLTGISSGNGNVNFSNVTSNIIPAYANLTLGNAAQPWAELYVSNSTIYIGGVPLTGSTSNVLSFAGNALVTANAVTTGPISATGAITGSTLYATGANGVASIGTQTVGGNLNIGLNNPSNISIGTGNANIYLGSSASNNQFNGNLSVAGNISTAGNIIGAYLYGDGSNITNVSAGNYGNSNVANYLSAGVITTNISTTGNIIGAYLYGDGSNITNVPAGNYGNSNVASYLSSGTITTNISTTGNIIGGNISGNIANAVSAITAGTVTSNAQGNITSVGTLSSLSVTGNITSASGLFRLAQLNQTQINTLTGLLGGELVYNTTTGTIQGYQIDPATSSAGWVSWTVAVYQ